MRKQAKFLIDSDVYWNDPKGINSGIYTIADYDITAFPIAYYLRNGSGEAVEAIALENELSNEKK